MISYLRGTLAALEEDKVIIDVGGVGYGVFMSGSSMGRLPSVGSEVKLHTYLNVKEEEGAGVPMPPSEAWFRWPGLLPPHPL